MHNGEIIYVHIYIYICTYIYIYIWRRAGVQEFFSCRRLQIPKSWRSKGMAMPCVGPSASFFARGSTEDLNSKAS